MFENKKIIILGMAKSGYEVAKILYKYTKDIVINDLKEDQELEHINELKELGIKVILGDHPDDLITKDVNFIIKNPGIKNDHKYVLQAKEYNIPVINEVEVAYLLLPKDITLIGITGSNGKTTTTTLIYEIIKSANMPVHLTGNIGYPLSAFVNKIKAKDIVVTEISIQQLCNLNKFKTNISVLTNLYEAHLDFVGGYENYINLKKKIFNEHTQEDVAVLNYDNNDVVKITNDINSKKYYFSSKKENVTQCYIKENSIYYNNNEIIKFNELKLTGIHNYENIMAAILVCKHLKISDEIIRKVLMNFNGVEHRIEFVKKINDIRFYNDSKSTNIVATITALKSFSTPIILLLGGLDRQHSFDELKDYMNNVKLVIAYGETKDRINDFCKRINKECTVFEDLKQATEFAYNNSLSGDTILLSPACASWDQYKNFEERGNKFKEYINNL